MLRSVLKWSPLGVALLLLAPIVAQEGHPLKGSWIGIWQSNAQHGDDVLLVMNWDGKRIGGVINPGTDNMQIENASLDPNGWKVHLEASAADKQGAALRYIIDGEIKDLEFPNRYITGTWQSQKGRGKFEVRRQ